MVEPKKIIISLILTFLVSSCSFLKSESKNDYYYKTSKYDCCREMREYFLCYRYPITNKRQLSEITSFELDVGVGQSLYNSQLSEEKINTSVKYFKVVVDLKDYRDNIISSYNVNMLEYYSENGFLDRKSLGNLQYSDYKITHSFDLVSLIEYNSSDYLIYLDFNYYFYKNSDTFEIGIDKIRITFECVINDDYVWIDSLPHGIL